MAEEKQTKRACCCRGTEESASALNAEDAPRRKHREPEEYRALMNRISRIEGQIRGIRSMLEEDRYCVDILTQVTAAKSALDSFSRELLNRHIESCVVDRIQQGDEEVVEELCGIVQKLLK